MGTAFCATATCDLVGIVMTILQLGQYIPQHVEMAVDRSVVGISPWLLFFGALYTHLAALDIIVSDGFTAFTCGEGVYRCFMNDQPLFQICGSAILSSTMWYWYLKYSHSDPALSSSAIEDEEEAIHGRFFYDSFPGVVFFHLFKYIALGTCAVTLFLLTVLGRDNPISKSFGYSCGILAAAVNAVMWLPQIVVTFAYGHKGALSFVWVFASFVMDVVYSVYLARMHLDFSLWANNIPDGLQTGLLCAMLLYFEYRDWSHGLDDYGHSRTGSGTPLKVLRDEETGTRETIPTASGNRAPVRLGYGAVQE